MNNSNKQRADIETPVYGSQKMRTSAPTEKIPMQPTAPEIAYQMVKDVRSGVETGNVDDYTVYPETLVIYHDEALSPAADAVVKAMGAGRAINGGSYYTFEADVLVIIGTDYQPIG